MYEETFLRRPLTQDGLERVIGGITYRGKRSLEIAVLAQGHRRSTTQISKDAAPVVAQAIEVAQSSRGRAEIGAFYDGRFRVEVTTGPHPSRSPAVFCQKVDEQGIEAGRVIALFGDDLDAIEAGITWLFLQ